MARKDVAKEARALPTNVGSDLASFVGREPDLAAISSKFDSGARLVTITGLGGIGKTRLARRFASLALDQYARHGGGGVWLADLTSASSASALLASIAGVLGIHAPAPDDRRRATLLGQALAGRKRVLIVLDNMETVLAHAETVLGVLLSEATLARFLVTSRVPLGLAGEERWPLDPLPLPTEPARALESPAVRLFIKRASEVRPQYAPDASEVTAASEIVTRLDGIPLAIELAAARMSVLSAKDLLRRLGRPLDVLVRAKADGRHRSMRAAVDDSIHALAERERASLAALSMFRGGFDLEAAEAVLGAEEALGSLETLVAHSLVRTTAGEGVRFFLFEAIRELASEAFASSAARAEVEVRFVRHFRARAERGMEKVDPADDENLGVALRLAVARRDADSALALAIAAAPRLSARSLFDASRTILGEALELAGEGRGGAAEETPPSLVIEALLLRAAAQRDLGDIASARADVERALREAESSPNLPRRLRSLSALRLAEVLETEGDTQSARERLREAVRELEAEPSPLLRADIHRRLGHAARREGDMALAAREAAQAVNLYRIGGDAEGLAFALYESAVVALFARDAAAAAAAFDEGLDLARVARARLAEGAIRSGLGVLHQEHGDLDRALEDHLSAVEIFRALGNRHREASALYYLGATYLERGQRADAEPPLRASLSLLSRVGAPRYDVLDHGMLATLRARAGDAAGASEHLVRAEQALTLCASEGALRATLDIHRLTVEALAEPAAPPALHRSAEERAASFPSDDTRLALRVFTHLLEDAEPPVSDALIVRSTASSFRLPGADADVDLMRREPLRRILLALAERRLGSPGVGLDKDELLAAGWPGERMSAAAGQNRVHVALTTLRKLGLRAYLVTGADGYSITSRTRVLLEQ